MPTAVPEPTGHGIGYAPTSCTLSMLTARMVPSSSNAMRTSPCSWRDWLAIRFSRRSSMNLIAAGTLRAARYMHMSSRCGLIFWPKAPPVSRAMTRTECSGMPRSRAANMRKSCGAWVAAQTVSSSPDHSTTHPRVSIGTAAYDCWVMVSSMTTGAWSKIGARSSAGRPVIWPRTLCSHSSQTRCSLS